MGQMLDALHAREVSAVATGDHARTVIEMSSGSFNLTTLNFLPELLLKQVCQLL